MGVKRPSTTISSSFIRCLSDLLNVPIRLLERPSVNASSDRELTAWLALMLLSEGRGCLNTELLVHVSIDCKFHTGQLPEGLALGAHGTVRGVVWVGEFGLF